MARLAHIFVYPVKSLDAVALDVVGVLASGALADDRRYTIVDADGRVINGKLDARIHRLRSSYDPATRSLTLSADNAPARTFDLEARRDALCAWLGAYFGFDVCLQENTDAGFPDDTESPGPTVVSTATLRTVADWFDITLAEARARFRANLELDGVPPFWEDGLYGRPGTTVRFTIGGVVFDGINPCQRCVVPGRDARTGVDAEGFAKRFVELRRRHLPEWAEASRFNHFYRLAVNTRRVLADGISTLACGDAVTVLGALGTPDPPPATEPSRPRPRVWAGRLRVVGVRDESTSVRTFSLVDADANGRGGVPFDFLPGQHLTLTLTVDGVRHQRCYTIASSPTRTDRLELTIKREPDGAVSRHFHDRVTAGTVFDASGPCGRFAFTGSEADGVVLIAGGVGITPVMSIVRYLTDRGWTKPIDLLYSVRNRRDVLFAAELADRQRLHPNLQVTTTLTAERDAVHGHRLGRIDAGLLSKTVPDVARRRVHLCGPSAMAADMRRILAAAGVPAAQVFWEAFGGAPAEARAAEARPAEARAAEPGAAVGRIAFAVTGRAATAFADRTLLSTAEAAGIAIDNGCLAGVCGRCKVRVLSGHVRVAADDALTDEDRADGYALACQTRPTGDVTLEL